MLHASSPHSVALMQLRFTSLTVVSSREDLHLQECAHAGRTTRTRARSRARVRCPRKFDVEHFRYAGASRSRLAPATAARWPRQSPDALPGPARNERDPASAQGHGPTLVRTFRLAQTSLARRSAFATSCETP